jgi:hypothetical protein
LATRDCSFFTISGKTGTDQKQINHFLDKVVSNASNPKDFLITIEIDICRHCSTVFGLLPLSMLLGPAELPSVPPHNLVVARQEG